MNIIEDKVKVVFRKDINNKASYSIGLSKKKENGEYENGYIPCRFKKDVTLENQTKIKIKSAWLDFYKVEKKTFIYLFINEFEKVDKELLTNQTGEETTQSVDNFSAGKDIELTDDDLPFYG